MENQENPIQIIYEDDDLLVLNKPAGITVNKSDTTQSQLTVQDWTESKLKIESEKLKVGRKKIDDYTSKEYFQQAFRERGGIVHRIDKETSGILLVAKNPDAFQNLQKQFKERTVQKTYIALAHGRIAPRNGEINVPVDRLPWNRRQFGIVAGGRESVTFYQVPQYFLMPGKQREELSLVELTPKTGRTHQIRVHLKYFNHPIFSDFLYAGRKTANRDRKLLNRVFLHAAKISFLHPKSGEEVHFESPLPIELKEFIEKNLQEIQEK